MTRKYIASFHDIPDLIQSRSFWEGVAIGFSPQRYICDYKAHYNLHDSNESAYESWVEVGDLLASATREFGHEQAAEQDPAANPGKRRAKHRAFAG